ncbi:MAG: hypothetical protein U1F11_00755 [Steroidobacteraceae bacterium]
MHRTLPVLGACCASLLGCAAFAAPRLDVEIYDRTAGAMLPVYEHRGRRYVAGEPGHEYEIRMRNDGPERLLAVTSVDGVDVLSGRTAARSGGGYVLDAWREYSIDGWRKSLGEVAAFYFTTLPDSYAARTGRPDNVGVIGVAVFRERQAHYAEQPPPIAPAPAPGLPAAPAEAESRRAERAASTNAQSDSAVGAGAPLGTGHGERHASVVEEVEFERASSRPDCEIRIYYDSRSNLLAQGIIPRRTYARRWPDPFPQSRGFVPDP